VSCRNLSKIKSSCLIFYYLKENRNSFRFLLGSIEKNKFLLKNYDFFFVYSPKDLKNIFSTITSYKRKIFCFSFFSTQIEDVLKISTYLRRKEVTKIVGGAFATSHYEIFLKMGFDYVSVGEAEDSFPLLLEGIIKERIPSNIEGVAYLKKDRIFFKSRSKSVEINNYLPISRYFKKIGPIEITRGCPYQCKFCSTPFIFDKKVRHRHLDNILQAVRIMKKLGFSDVRFLSPNAFSYFSSGKTPNLEMIEKLLKKTREIVTSKGKIFFGSFPSEIRPDFINREGIRLLKKFVNNDNIIIGAQSGSNRLLKSLYRGHAKEDVIEATRITTQGGFKAYIDIILGFPDETYEDRKETIKFIEELIKLKAKIHLHYFLPLSGTPFFLKKPSFLEKEIKKKIEEWEGRGKIFGQWRKQLILSQKLSIFNENFLKKVTKDKKLPP